MILIEGVVKGYHECGFTVTAGEIFFLENKANLLSIMFFAEIKMKQEKSIISMKIDKIDDNQ